MVSFEPISGQYSVIARGRGERNGDHRTAEDSNAAESARRLVEGERREVEIASDLVLNLQNVREVLSGRDRAIRAENSVLP